MIYCDFPQPGNKTGVLPEGLDIFKYADKHILYNLQAILAIKGDTIGNFQESVLVSFDKNIESPILTFFQPFNQILFIYPV